MLQSRKKSCRFFGNITQQVLPDNKLAMLKKSYTKKNDRPGEKTHRLNVEENIILRFMKSGRAENGRMGLRVTGPDEFHYLPGIPRGYAIHDPVRSLPELRMPGKILQCLVSS